jgi:hypothetical protein
MTAASSTLPSWARQAAWFNLKKYGGLIRVPYAARAASNLRAK